MMVFLCWKEYHHQMLRGKEAESVLSHAETLILLDSGQSKSSRFLSTSWMERAFQAGPTADE